MRTQTKETQENLTPDQALEILKHGNERFAKNLKTQRDLYAQVIETSLGQFPFAVILSCIDARVPAELIFDQGIGDIFSVRVAGNIVNEDILGSIEYGCNVAGAKIVIVLGHTKCGAVTAACKDVELGNITLLLNKIKPAVNAIKKGNNALDDDAIESVAIENIRHSINRIKNESPILAEMAQSGRIKIVAASYNVANGVVSYL